MTGDNSRPTMVQIRTYITNLLSRLFSNRSVLNKFTEDNGVLKYNGKEIKFVEE